MDKKIWHQKMSPPDLKVSNMLPGKSGELLIASEKNDAAGKSRNNAQ